MKYNMTKKVSYSLIVLVLLVGLIFTTLFGLDSKGYGSAKKIDLGLDLAGGVSVTYEIDEKDFTTQDVEDTIYKLQKRVEGKSTESQVYRQGDNRITVEIPGVTDANEVLKELGKPGALEFLDTANYQLWLNNEEYTTLLTGNEVKTAEAKSTTSGEYKTPYLVELTFTDEGAHLFEEATGANIGSSIIIIYENGDDVRDQNDVVSNASVTQKIVGDSAVITNLDSAEEAENLATFIRIGSIPLTLSQVSANSVGAQIGQSAIKTSLMAAIIGLVLLCIFMIIMYRLPGVVATLTISIYTTLVLFLVSVYDITLTLPGIAGIILGIGMAVDGNVIIYTRIREEIGEGKNVETAILAGYNKATSAIVDGNVTTLIAAVVLYLFGTGPVKGFASTLAVSNIVSIFTALVITKTIMKLFYNFGLTSPALYGKTVHKKTLDVLSIKKFAFIGSAVVILAGFVWMGVQQSQGNKMLNFGLEFAGGSSTTFTFEEDYTQQVVEDEMIPIIQKAAGVTEVIQQMDDDSTKVTFKTPELSQEEEEAVEEAIKAKYPIKEDTVVEFTTISGSVSDTMKKDAIISVTIATILMLIYIFVRFRDIRFALAAVIALLHDVLVVLAFYAFARVSVNTTFIACMLTIVGYSINGTIIIFDRIREQLRTANSRTNITELVNSSITSTMSRTINTSITTLIMLVVLFVLGITSVKEFALPLIVGIVVGAYSSICITSALWYIMGGKKRGIVEEIAKSSKKKAEVFEDGSQV